MRIVPVELCETRQSFAHFNRSIRGAGGEATFCFSLLLSAFPFSPAAAGSLSFHRYQGVKTVQTMENSSEFSIVCTVSSNLCKLMFDPGLWKIFMESVILA